MSDRVVRVVAALIRDGECGVLLGRKRGARAFMQPGGRRDAGKSDVAALSREIVEELGCRVIENSVRGLGVFSCAAANEPGFQVKAAVYAVDVNGAIAPKAEIDQIIWVNPEALPDLPLAPLTRDHVLPLARAGA